MTLINYQTVDVRYFSEKTMTLRETVARALDRTYAGNEYIDLDHMADAAIKAVLSHYAENGATEEMRDAADNANLRDYENDATGYFEDVLVAMMRAALAETEKK